LTYLEGVGEGVRVEGVRVRVSVRVKRAPSPTLTLTPTRLTERAQYTKMDIAEFFSI